MSIRMKGFKKTTKIDEALKTFFKNLGKPKLRKESITLTKALNRILAEDVVSDVDVPPFDRAAMDGYAVKAEDTFGAEEDNPVRLRVTGRIEAGEKPDIEVKAGEAVEIATGAPIPKGADSVVMVEYTNRIDEGIEIFKAVSPGENISPAGSDIMMGELILRRGQRITPREMGILAAIGLKSIKVLRRPRVAIISTLSAVVAPILMLSISCIVG